MWKKVTGFSNYLINEDGDVVNISAAQRVGRGSTVVSMRADDGEWKNRSIAKLVKEHFDNKPAKIIATPIFSTNKITFESIKDAANWLINNGIAITSGRLAAYGTVRNNIAKGINQPNLYPYIYGYSWKLEERS